MNVWSAYGCAIVVIGLHLHADSTWKTLKQQLSSERYDLYPNDAPTCKCYDSRCSIHIALAVNRPACACTRQISTSRQDHLPYHPASTVILRDWR